MSWLVERWQRFGRLYRREIWQPAHLKDASWRGFGYAALRIISITFTGLGENKVASRAAALSYSSLLGLGPLVAIAVLVSGFMLNRNDPNLAAHTLNRFIQFIAPQVVQYEHLSAEGKAPPLPPAKSDVLTAATLGAPAANPAPSASAAAPGPSPAANAELVQLINSFVASARSGTAGVIGALTLILIVIQLFTTIENSFNDIWGVRRGRGWVTRIVFYWTIVTLGAVVFFAALTALSAAAFLNVFIARLPFGPDLLHLLRWMLPALSALLLVLTLAVFYRYIPNTRVFWRSAFIGGLLVTALLFLNNYLAFLYFRRVVLSKSLYGSLGILPILMLGLYIFWFFVLVGGQITYAIQNVNFRSSQAAWNNLNETARESLSLAALLLIGRQFRACLPPLTASELGEQLRTPTQILNECLNRLCDLRLVNAIPSPDSDSSSDHRYQPSRPLNRITLLDFKNLFDGHGENPAGEALNAFDPVLRFYHEQLARHTGDALGGKSLEELLAEMPSGKSAAGAAPA